MLVSGDLCFGHHVVVDVVRHRELLHTPLSTYAAMRLKRYRRVRGCAPVGLQVPVRMLDTLSTV